MSLSAYCLNYLACSSYEAGSSCAEGVLRQDSLLYYVLNLCSWFLHLLKLTFLRTIHICQCLSVLPSSSPLLTTTLHTTIQICKDPPGSNVLPDKVSSHTPSLLAKRNTANSAYAINGPASAAVAAAPPGVSLEPCQERTWVWRCIDIHSCYVCLKQDTPACRLVQCSITDCMSTNLYASRGKPESTSCYTNTY